MPNRKIRKLFKLKKREIPKWLYLEFYISFIYIALFVVSTLLYLLLDNKPLIAQFLEQGLRDEYWKFIYINSDWVVDEIRSEKEFLSFALDGTRQ